jgi:hypothetical protein
MQTKRRLRNFYTGGWHRAAHSTHVVQNDNFLKGNFMTTNDYTPNNPFDIVYGNEESYHRIEDLICGFEQLPSDGKCGILLYGLPWTWPGWIAPGEASPFTNVSAAVVRKKIRKLVSV